MPAAWLNSEFGLPVLDGVALLSDVGQRDSSSFLQKHGADITLIFLGLHPTSYARLPL